jgi:hypothetical protein
VAHETWHLLLELHAALAARATTRCTWWFTSSTSRLQVTEAEWLDGVKRNVEKAAREAAALKAQAV